MAETEPGPAGGLGLGLGPVLLPGSSPSPPGSAPPPLSSHGPRGASGRGAEKSSFVLGVRRLLPAPEAPAPSGSAVFVPFPADATRHKCPVHAGASPQPPSCESPPFMPRSRAPVPPRGLAAAQAPGTSEGGRIWRWGLYRGDEATVRPAGRARPHMTASSLGGDRRGTRGSRGARPGTPGPRLQPRLGHRAATAQSAALCYGGPRTQTHPRSTNYRALSLLGGRPPCAVAWCGGLACRPQ